MLDSTTSLSSNLGTEILNLFSIFKSKPNVADLERHQKPRQRETWVAYNFLTQIVTLRAML